MQQTMADVDKVEEILAQVSVKEDNEQPPMSPSVGTPQTPNSPKGTFGVKVMHSFRLPKQKESKTSGPDTETVILSTEKDDPLDIDERLTREIPTIPANMRRRSMSNPQKIGRGLSQSVPILEDAPSSTQLSRKELRQRNAAIEKELARERTRIRKEKHLLILLLGPGDAGKSTVLKQFVLLHGQGFTESELEHYKLVIHSNIINNMKVLLKGRSLHANAQVILNYQVTSAPIPNEIWETAESLWASPFIQKDFKQVKGLELDSNIEYFFNNIKRISDPSFKPTTDDILQCRSKTQHVSETVLELQQVYWHLIDVAGQRDKRSKWTAYFDQRVDCMLYVLSAPSYCQMMEENPETNRLVDALELFESLALNPILKPTSYIVLMNKTDILKDQINTHPPGNYLKDYKGENITDYYNYLYTATRSAVHKKNSGASFYIHRTCATDRKIMRKVLNDIEDAVTKSCLKQMGLA